jgi:hypothetical protein
VVKSVWLAWAISAAVLLLSALVVGKTMTGLNRWFGLLIDSRHQYSLTKLQISLWTIVVLSLIAGVAFGRAVHHASALGFEIPDVLLVVMGISLGSTVAATTVKTTAENRTITKAIAAGRQPSLPRDLSTSTPRQFFQREEGGVSIEEIDLTKFQNFWITLIVVAAYVTLVITTFGKLASPAEIVSLPTMEGTFATLLAISHATYIAGKLASD